MFDLSGERCAIRLDSLREIVAMAALSRPPSLASLLDGFLNLGGDALPVLRTAAILGLEDEGPDLYTPLLVVRGAAGRFVLRVSRVVAVRSIESVITPLDAADSFNGCVEGRLLIDGEPVHLLKIDNLLLEQEWRAVAEFRALEARRLSELDAVAS
jgi:chemotaxis signal transduction protein